MIISENDFSVFLNDFRNSGKCVIRCRGTNDAIKTIMQVVQM